MPYRPDPKLDPGRHPPPGKWDIPCLVAALLLCAAMLAMLAVMTYSLVMR